ncbi:MAG: MFS transporter, partial [Candidatus Helarchaeota archaeon]
MKTSNKIFYGLSRVGTAITLGIIDFAIIGLYRDHFGLADEFTLFATFFGLLIIAFSSFFMGYLSDRIKTKIGRRRPFILIGVPILSISFIFVLSPQVFFGVPTPGFNTPLFIYLIVLLSIYKFMYGLLVVPYQAWLPELVDDEKETTDLSFWENIFNTIGQAIMIIATVLILPEVGIAADKAPNIASLTIGFYIFLILGIISALVFIPAFIRLREDESKFIPQPSLRKELRVIKENKNCLKFILFQGIASLGLAMVVGNILPFTQLILQFESWEYYLAAITFLLSVLIGYIVIKRSIVRNGKKYTLRMVMIMFASIMPFTVVIGYLVIFQVVSHLIVLIVGIVFLIFVSNGIAGWYIFPYIVYSDIALKDEIETGEPRAAFYQGFSSVPLNIFQAVSMLLTMFIFNANVIPPIPGFFKGSGEPVSFGFIWWGIFAAAFIGVSLLIFQKVELDFDFDELRKKYGRNK